MFPHAARSALIALAVILWLAPWGPALAAEGLVVYSARKEELIRPAIEAFQQERGIKVSLLTGKAGELARRIEIERGDPKGDVFLGTTAGVTELLRRKGALEPYPSPYAKEIPEEFKAPDGSWVGITGRVRVIIYNKNLVKDADAPRSFFDLTDPKWRGKIVVASMGERTTVGHLATIMALRGEEFTTRYVRALKDNGLKVLSNNTEVRKAVTRGEYAVGITNHYYYLLQLRENPASPLGIIYPDQGPGDMGAPVYSITAAIVKGAKSLDAAKKFVDFLLQPKGNRLLVEGEFEIPLLPGARLVGDDRGILGLGQFKKAAVTQIQVADFEPTVEKLFGPLLIP
ncbi:MAG: extracellular solute-binding protein [Candidatus Rokubacteria bacterium]|nr:extracellular solute-binding protein [Candidatus Rokubacteria bacterium]MBI2555567.1 extracellular solute-binding protein [Candidatus Rokubacteria bacterium]